MLALARKLWAAFYNLYFGLFSLLFWLKRGFPRPSDRTDEGLGEEASVIYPHSRIYAVGTYLASAMFLPLKSEAVLAMLPRALELAPQSLTPAGQHPVLLLFGHHHDVHPNFLRIEGMDYLEFVVAIPYLQWRHTRNAYRGPFAYMPQLYLNEWLPVFLGWFYGYAKWRALMRAGPRSYEVKNLVRDTPLISLNFDTQGPFGPIAEFPLFDALRESFKLPFVGRTLLGFWLCSYLDFKLDKGLLQSITGNVRIASAFVPGLPVGDFHFDGLATQPLGAFRIMVPWTLAVPLECGSMRP